MAENLESKDQQAATKLAHRLFNVYGADHALTPVTMHALEGIADLIVMTFTPDAYEDVLTKQAPAYGGYSILECVRRGDLDTPLGSLASLAEGAP